MAAAHHRRLNVVFATLTLILAMALSGVSGIDTRADSGWYLSAAFNVYQGAGYVDFQGDAITNRGPIFAAMLALGWLIDGVSMDAAAWLIRIFFAVNLLLVYALATRVFNPVAGIVAVLGCLGLSLFHEVHSRILVDGPVSAFMLATLWLTVLAKPTNKAMVAAGACLGLGYLVKEVALVFAALPLGYQALAGLQRFAGTAPAEPTRFNARMTLQYWIAFAAVVAIWMVSAGGSVNLLGWAGPKVLAALGVIDATGGLDLNVDSERSVYGHLEPVFFTLTLPAVAAAAAVGCRAQHGTRVIGAALLSLLPVVYYVGAQQLRLGQVLPVALLMIICAAGWLVTRAPHWFAKLPVPLLSPAAIGIGCSALVLLWHVGLQPTARDVLMGKTVDRVHGVKLTGNENQAAFTVTGFIPRLADVAAQLARSTDSSTKTASDIYTGSALYFLNRGAHEFSDFSPMFVALPTPTTALYLFDPAWNPLRLNRIVSLDRERARQTLTQNQIDAIVLRGRYRDLAPALSALSGASVRRVGATLMLDIDSESLPPFNSAAVDPARIELSDALATRLRTLREQRPDAYADTVVPTLSTALGIERASLQRLIERRTP